MIGSSSRALSVLQRKLARFFQTFTGKRKVVSERIGRELEMSGVTTYCEENLRETTLNLIGSNYRRYEKLSRVSKGSRRLIVISLLQSNRFQKQTNILL